MLNDPDVLAARAPAAVSRPATRFVAPFQVHLCWFADPQPDPRCIEIARELYEILHRPQQDNIVSRPGIEIPVAYGQSLPGLLDELEAGASPSAPPVARLVIA